MSQLLMCRCVCGHENQSVRFALISLWPRPSFCLQAMPSLLCAILDLPWSLFLFSFFLSFSHTVDLSLSLLCKPNSPFGGYTPVFARLDIVLWIGHSLTSGCRFSPWMSLKLLWSGFFYTSLELKLFFRRASVPGH